MADGRKQNQEVGQASAPEVVQYSVGVEGYRDVASYDAKRYLGAANEYKQTVMANAYRRLMGPLVGKSVLDVGCGTGRGVLAFAREAAFAVGADASVDMLRFAQSKAEAGVRCRFASSYAQQLPFRDATFDIVTSLNFLHLFSLEAQRDMVAEMKRVTKPGGILVLEFDNALNGLLVGPLKRVLGIERGALPGEIRRVIGGGCRLVQRYGAVFPLVWRIFYRFPGVFVPLEKIAYAPLFNFLAHRIYYKLVREK